MIKGLLLAAYDPLLEYHYLLDSIFVSPGFHRRLFTLSMRQHIETVLFAACWRQCRVAPMIRLRFMLLISWTGHISPGLRAGLLHTQTPLLTVL